MHKQKCYQEKVPHSDQCSRDEMCLKRDSVPLPANKSYPQGRISNWANQNWQQRNRKWLQLKRGRHLFLEFVIRHAWIHWQLIRLFWWDLSQEWYYDRSFHCITYLYQTQTSPKTRCILSSDSQWLALSYVVLFSNRRWLVLELWHSVALLSSVCSSVDP